MILTSLKFFFFLYSCAPVCLLSHIICNLLRQKSFPSECKAVALPAPSLTTIYRLSSMEFSNIDGMAFLISESDFCEGTAFSVDFIDISVTNFANSAPLRASSYKRCALVDDLEVFLTSNL